ncbi:MAG: cytochrome c [Planctomycetota bacterium]|nr:cytochrome c [Planctomycetota bacterium]MCX8039876.1 cytochrome c [Planctomycetota bacterium]MDW8372165.1 cytochrome c [Planctomycetota bacterium]
MAERRWLLLAVCLLAACGEEKDERGLTVLPDMHYTPALESQDAGVAELRQRDPQGREVVRVVHYPAQLAPPDGAVARDRALAPPEVGDLAAARALRNPLLPTAAVLQQGQRDYLSYCAPCHGRNGKAATSALAPHFSGIPDLAAPGLIVKPEGELYHIISRGRGRMPDFAAQIPPPERWALVHFVRLQAIAASSDEELARLEAQAAGDPQAADAQRALAEARRLRRALGSAGEGWEFRPEPPPEPEWRRPQWPLPEGPR